MAAYRTALVWPLCPMAIGQIVLGVGMWLSMARVTQGMSPPPAVQPHAPFGQLMSIFLGPVAFLALAEALAVINARNAGNAR